MVLAQKKLSSSGGFLAMFWGGSCKQEEAVELYVRAANAFKMGKYWMQAGDAFYQAAKLQQASKNRHDAATSLVESANCHKKVNPQEAVRMLLEAVDIYTDMGRFNIAAKHHTSVGELFEADLADFEQAVQHFERAADYYKGEESNAAANKCLAKVALLSAQREDFVKASAIFEQLGKASMENQLLRYGAKDHFFKAAVCHMNIDFLNARQAVERYNDMFPVFADSREYKLLDKLLAAADEENVDAYTESVREYDSISRIDPWLTSLLLRAKKTLSGDEADLC